jgi:hypothetical protein
MASLKAKIIYDGGVIPNERFASVITGLNKKLNAWLAAHPDIDIVNILQSESQSYESTWNITITIFYREVHNGTNMS